jgi:hypothetical protein
MRGSSSVELARARTWLGDNLPEAALLRRAFGPTARAALVAAFLAAWVACSSSSTSVTSPTSVRCAVTLSLSPTTLDAAGGSGQITVSVDRDCPWQARSEADWIALAPPASGQGDSNLRYTASANTVVSARRGAVVVNDQRIELTQAAAACSFVLNATGGSVPAEGGGLRVDVAAQSSCTWTAGTSADWVRIDSGREGNGQGTVGMTVSPNTGPAREARLLIAGQTYTVSQAAGDTRVGPGCAFDVSPESESFGVNGGGGTIRIRASGPDCGWTAVSTVSWIIVADGAGSGNGNARYAVAPNPGEARSGAIRVAGDTVTVTQAGGGSPACVLEVSPQSESFGANGGEDSVSVRASSSNCAWTVAPNVPWISVSSGGGRGNADVRYVVSSNPGPARNGTLAVAGAIVAVTQAAASACAFKVSPLTEAFPATGGEGRVRVEADGSSCSWTASSNASWISLSTTGGNGGGDVRYVVAPNTGGPRSGTLTVARATVTVMQAAVSVPDTVSLRGHLSDLGGRCPNLTFTLEGRRVRTSQATDFDERCDRLRNRDRVTVRGVVQSDGWVLALRVEDD